MSKQPQQTRPDEVETTGHSWDGIEEFNNPLPRWWLWTFYLCIIWAVAYSIAYPAWPMISKATPGLLGYSTRAQVAEEIATAEAANAAIETQLASVDLTEIATTPELNQYANNAGAAVFRTWCAQCHGSGAAGVHGAGYPNLQDDDWLWGGDIEAIHYTISHGIRNEDDLDARYSEMPAFGDIFAEEEIAQTAEYVLKLSGQDHDATLAAAGETLFLDNCAACHGDNGEGVRDLGAPNLSDAIWLRQGTREAIIAQITAPKNGVMPNWNTRLSEADIRAVASYVHSLGGGEATPAME